MDNLETQQGDIGARVERALEVIRPYLIKDGGNVRVINITRSNDLVLEFLGSCHDCPMSDMTFRSGVEQTIKNAVPEIRTIEII